MTFRSSVVLLLSVLCIGVWAGEPVSQQTLQVSPGVTLAGSLTADATEQLALADTLVVDLRGTVEGSDAEARALALAGVDYVHLPVTASVPDAGDVQFLGDLLAANGHRPVVIHCRSGNRAALLWGAHRLDQGKTLPDVLKEVQPIATSEVIAQRIEQYAQSLEAAETPNE